MLTAVNGENMNEQFCNQSLDIMKAAPSIEKLIIIGKFNVCVVETSQYGGIFLAMLALWESTAIVYFLIKKCAEHELAIANTIIQ